MSAQAPPIPVPRTSIAEDDLWRLSVDRYHRMIAAGIVTPDDRVELLEDVLVNKTSKSPLHRLSVLLVCDALRAILPGGWHVQSE